MITEQKLEYLIGAIVCRDLTGWMLSRKDDFGFAMEFTLDLCPGVRMGCTVHPFDPLSHPRFGVYVDIGFSFALHDLEDVSLCRGNVVFTGESSSVTLRTAGHDVTRLVKRLLSEDPRPLMETGYGTVPLRYGGFIAERRERVDIPPWDSEGMSKAIRFAYLRDRDVVEEMNNGVSIRSDLTVAASSHPAWGEFEFMSVRYKGEDVEFRFCGAVDATSDSFDLYYEGGWVNIPVDHEMVGSLVNRNPCGMSWTPDYLSDHPCRDYRGAAVTLPPVIRDPKGPNLGRVDTFWRWEYEDDD